MTEQPIVVMTIYSSPKLRNIVFPTSSSSGLRDIVVTYWPSGKSKTATNKTCHLRSPTSCPQPRLCERHFPSLFNRPNSSSKRFQSKSLSSAYLPSDSSSTTSFSSGVLPLLCRRLGTNSSCCLHVKLVPSRLILENSSFLSTISQARTIPRYSRTVGLLREDLKLSRLP